MYLNPYTPGAGARPHVLAGRDKEIADAGRTLKSLEYGIYARSFIYTGLRGVGKTVLLNRIEEIASMEGVNCVHIEIETKKAFIPQITTATQTVLRKLSLKEKLKPIVNDVVAALKSLSLSFDPQNSTFDVKLEDRDLYVTSDLEMSLTDLFVQLGKLLKMSEQSLCLFIDEIQLMKAEELSALIVALHRVNQLGYPIAMFGAGLPRVFKLMGDAKTYSERLFEYVTIDNFTHEQASVAICEPAEGQGVKYTDNAVDTIIEITGGYPFFIQVLCDVIWENNVCEKIGRSCVEKNVPAYLKKLDDGFFRVRYDRCTEGEKAFLYAMVDCGELPCTVANVAANLNKTVTSISPARAKLINKGLIYATSRGELDFTVSKFDEFLSRNRSM